MNALCENNQITIVGTINSSFSYSHACCGEHFFSFVIESSRLSDTKDYLPVVISERMMSTELYEGRTVRVVGQVRSQNIKSEEGKRKVKLFIFALQVCPTDEPDTNEAYISGFICTPPVYRKTPEGRHITDLLIAVPRHTEKHDYLPAIAWGRDATYAATLDVGTPISIFARFQSREYDKTINGVTEKRTAYELSIRMIEKGTPYE